MIDTRLHREAWVPTCLKLAASVVLGSSEPASAGMEVVVEEEEEAEEEEEEEVVVMLNRKRWRW